MPINTRYPDENNDDGKTSNSISLRTKVSLAGLGLVSVLALSTALGSFFTVAQNEVAVVTSFGKFSYLAQPGLNFKLPFVMGTNYYRTDLRSIKPEKGVNTYTVDNQEVDVIFTVFYRTPSSKISFLFENNQDYEQRLFSLTIDRLKAAMGQVNVQSVAEKRGELRDMIKGILVHDGNALGVEVMDFQLTDMQYTDSFRAAVNNAAVQKANIESVEYQRQQAQKQAETVEVKAKGEAAAQRVQAAGAADARLLQAQAEAKAIQLQGEAQATAIKAQGDALAVNSRLVELRKAERWDGKLPVNMYANAPIPFLNQTEGK